MMQLSSRAGRLGLMLGVLCGTVACTPARDSTRPDSSVARASRQAQASPAGDAARSARQSCDRVDSLVAILLAEQRPAASGAAATARTPAVTRGDTVFAYWYNAATAPGCYVRVKSNAPGDPNGLFDPLTRRLESSGWQSLVTNYSADGPDGSVVGFRWEDTVCIVDGRWDGGDDSDTTYVPAPGYEVVMTCAPFRSDDVPNG
jgi:hypothetical protein